VETAAKSLGPDDNEWFLPGANRIFGMDEPPKTLSDEACRRIRQDIIAGMLPPGSQLRVEQLKSEYGIGATPLREALSRLASQGLVTMEGQRGFRVAALSIENLQDVTRLRIMLETQALRESIAVGDDRWEARIVGIHHQLAKTDPAVDFVLYERWNRQFHDALIGACGSPLLLRYRAELYDQHERYRSVSSSHTVHPRDVAGEHRAILDATLARDADLAARLTADHIQHTADLVGDVLRARLAPAVFPKGVRVAAS
jgi:DNA-binding GntR family transcriptional regulator